MDEPRNGKSFVGYRYGSLVVVSLFTMKQINGHRRQAIWRANCDCTPDGKNFVLGATEDLRRKKQCEDCQKAARKKKRLQVAE